MDMLTLNAKHVTLPAVTLPHLHEHDKQPSLDPATYLQAVGQLVHINKGEAGVLLLSPFSFSIFQPSKPIILMLINLL